MSIAEDRVKKQQRYVRQHHVKLPFFSLVVHKCLAMDDLIGFHLLQLVKAVASSLKRDEMGECSKIWY